MNGAEELFRKYREIGPAVWLLTLYWAACDQEENPWFLVMNGEPLSDQEVAVYLGVSVHTATRWRKKLQRTGFVLSESRVGGFQIRVKRPRFVYAAMLGYRTPVFASWPKVATELVQ